MVVLWFFLKMTAWRDQFCGVLDGGTGETMVCLVDYVKRVTERLCFWSVFVSCLRSWLTYIFYWLTVKSSRTWLRLKLRGGIHVLEKIIVQLQHYHLCHCTPLAELSVKVQNIKPFYISFIEKQNNLWGESGSGGGRPRATYPNSPSGTKTANHKLPGTFQTPFARTR